MFSDLISDQDIAELPDDPKSQFVAIEAICRRNVSRLITGDSPTHFDAMVRRQYITTISTTADEFGFSNLLQHEEKSDPVENFNDFLLAAGALATRLRLRNAGSNSATSVRIGHRTRGQIELQVNRLREIIDESNLSDDRKSSLVKKLDELLGELSQPRVSFAKVMAILAFIGMGVSETTGFLADAPEALTAITSLIGADKAAEEEEALRIGSSGTQKALPAPVIESSNPKSGLDEADQF